MKEGNSMTTSATEETPVKTHTKRPAIIWSIVLMAWPAVGIILSIALYAISNLLFSTGQQTPPGAEALMFAEEASNPWRVVVNVILFIVGGSAVALGPISFIGGLVLLIVTLNKK